MSVDASDERNEGRVQRPDRVKFLFRISVGIACVWLLITVYAVLAALGLSSERRPAQVRISGECQEVEFTSQSPTELTFKAPATSFRKIESSDLKSTWSEPLQVRFVKGEAATDITRLEAIPEPGDSLQLAAQRATVLNVAIPSDTLARIQTSGLGEDLRLEITAIQAGDFHAHGMKVLPSNIDFEVDSQEPVISLPRLNAFELSPSVPQLAEDPISVAFTRAFEHLGTVQMWWQDDRVSFEKGKTEFVVNSISLTDIRVAELVLDGQAVTDYSEGHLKIRLGADNPITGLRAKMVSLDDKGMSILVEGTANQLSSLTGDGQREILPTEFERIDKAPVDSSNILTKVFVIWWLDSLVVAVTIACVLGAFAVIKATIVPKRRDAESE